MLLAAEFQVGQVLWSMFWYFLFYLWIWLVITIFADILRSDDLSGWGKAAWSIFVIFLPYLGVFVYLIARGDSMGKRHVRDAQAQDDAMQSYIRDAAGSGGSANELAQLAELHSSGKLSDDEYARAKAKAIG
jgi:hypothetical protein